jgi:pSer/pThr/pTyr-binding forkhead associated (FHA) protein
VPDSLLTVLRLLLLSLIWLFFVRVLFLLAAKPRSAAAVATPAPAPSVNQAAAPTTGRAASGKASLRVVSAGPLANAEFVVDNEATVGRGQGCQVQLADPMVSQLHARLFRADRGLHIEDLGSTNGTFVNAKKVSAPVKLKKGDRIRVGPVELEVVG